jgi:pectate lyase
VFDVGGRINLGRVVPAGSERQRLGQQSRIDIPSNVTIAAKPRRARSNIMGRRRQAGRSNIIRNITIAPVMHANWRNRTTITRENSIRFLHTYDAIDIPATTS